MSVEQNSAQKVSLLASIIPVITLVGLLIISVYLYGDDTQSGASQMSLLMSGGVALLIGKFYGFKWRQIEKAIAHGVGNTINAILILLMVGALIGTWVLSGTVPAMIYYGLQVINPDFFYFTACVLCAITAISIGSSWSTAGTVGVGLIGISAGLGLSPEITAGAIISGAYFGDKMSPLSDTTNLAPAVAGTDLFTHIRHMIWTTVPAISIALILYLIIGLNTEIAAVNINIQDRLNVLDQNFNIGLHLLIPMGIVFYLAFKRYPAFPTIMIGALVGGIFAVIFQQDTILSFVKADHVTAVNLFDGVWRALFGGYTADTGNADMDSLLSRGGMASMLNTIWLVISAITFGSIIEKLGMLKRIVDSTIHLAQTTGSLILTTALTCIGINILAADQYISIVLPGRMYRLEFKERGLASKNLSRVLEDTGTVTSVLIPWNTCGAFMAGTLMVSTYAYFPYCFFNILSPCVSILYGYLNFKIEKIDAAEEALAE
ncbi:Na+/H+ antiporter NhaC [Paremcibacter congregatus]|uniref:Na+/H+ antiporter NhaC n=1 Tax=Paremcibacter congregatus TaxID=2043170 RepID=UPI0030ED6DE6|tara:strand:+ start:8296 stop:9765 length:1470 start_codon:yes stop_codon:yes gene_type:complete